ncbi:hypothetical protein H4219_002735 [Mycoemilia scoparia]|uniref:Uncharacterized protein n=1 Tax=Mycoemilia scoparia TaxID=417184 RepID=A0A9W7ZXL5_9FUNG|nr:hypothetical protein H4219_002735 [Mycoemilia scoparia]
MFRALVFGGIESNGAKVETSIVSDAISSTSSALILGAATVLTTATHGVSLENIPQGRPEDLQPNRHELTSIEKISDINTLLVDTIESEYINQDAQSETLIQEPPQKTAHKEDTSSSNTSKKKKPKRTKSPTKATPRSTQKSANHQESVDPGPPKPPKPSLHAEHVEL